MSKVRGPIMISLDITNKCNLRCLHCYNNSGETEVCNNELSDDEMINLAKQICEMKPYNICFCGGEPLLRSEILIKCLKLFNENGILCSLVTNGFFLTQEIAQQLKINGIGMVQISLDGIEKSHNKLRGNKQAYTSAINAIKILYENGIAPGIAFSPTSWNIEDFSEVHNIAKKYNVQELRLQELMPIGRAKENNILPSIEQYNILRDYAYQNNLKYYKNEEKINIEWGDPISHLNLYANLNMGCGFTECIAIHADGGVTPSMYFPFTIGNIRRHSLSDYWENGLETIWKNEEIIKLANAFYSVSGMEQTMEYIEKYLLEKYGSLNIDLIDRKVGLYE